MCVHQDFISRLEEARVKSKTGITLDGQHLEVCCHWPFPYTRHMENCPGLTLVVVKELCDGPTEDNF
jgi:hypothetical protein